MKKIYTLLLLLSVFCLAEVQAQSIGISYETRSEEPKTGIGIHFQNDYTVVPLLLNVGLRVQGSFFNESYTLRQEEFDLNTEDTAYDFGLGAIATLSAGFVAPYAGIGVGYELFDRESVVLDTPGTPADAIGIESDDSDNGFYYYGTIGVGVSAVPILRPYIEYRYRGVSSTDFMPSSYGIWAFGMQLRF